MNAGSPPPTGTEGSNGWKIVIAEPVTVEIDTEATAAYIRLRAATVARTEPFGDEQGLVMVDFDSADQVIGIEIIGQHEFSIWELLKLVPAVRASEAVLARTRYVAAELQTA